MEDDLKCCICLDFAEEAVETGCCFQVYCNGCLTSLDECPTCRSDLVIRPSMVIRRIIGRLPVTCSNTGCKRQTTRADLHLHLMKCEFQDFVCLSNGCVFSGTKSAFANHIATVHTNDLVKNHKKLFENDNETSRITSVSCYRYEGEITARLGATGKYYCGSFLGGNCTCCDGHCGLGNGCNCVQCMKLDVAARKLSRNWFVNRDGFACRKGETGHFYCGRKVMEEDGCDGYCGPTNGPSCYACTMIEQQHNSRYAGVWTN